MSDRSDFRAVRVSLHEFQGDLLAIWHFPGGSSIPPLRIDRTTVETWLGWVARCDAATRGVGVSGAVPDRRVADLNTVGREVFDKLVTPRAQTAWQQEFAAEDGRRLKQPLRLEFCLERAETESPADYVTRIARLGAIPLETMRCQPTVLSGVSETVVLGDKVSVVRKVTPIGDLASGCLDVDGKLGVLVFTPTPDVAGAEPPLEAKREVAAIRGFEEESGGRIETRIIGRFGQRRATLAALAELAGDKQSPFHVFHFIGHGRVRPGGAGVELLLEDEQGRPDWRDFSSVANELFRSQARLLVLNGCQTAAVSALAAQFPAVVGMQFEISDEAAQLFAEGFYQQLAETGQLDDAVWAGRRKILAGSAQAREDYRHPVLYMQSEDGLLLRIPPRVIERTLPDGRLGVAYRAPLTAKGGRGPHRWSAETLPSGLDIGETTGSLEGVPREAGRRNVTIRVLSHDGLPGEVRFPLTIHAGGEDTPVILTEAIG